MTGDDPVERRFGEIAARHDRCFWLDGGGGLGWSGRRSLLGWLEPGGISLCLREGVVHRVSGGREVALGTDIFTALARECEADPEADWVGYFGYDARADLPARTSPRTPSAVWMRADHLEEYVHQAPAAESAAGLRPGAAGEPTPDYVAAFEHVQAQLRAGNSYEVNLTYREQTTSDIDPVSAYLRLRRLNPAPYAGFLQHADRLGRVRVLSSSPERYATIDRHRVLETRPIKGTTPRGEDAAEDRRLRERLRTDPKIIAENLMIVDLLRNDVAIVSEPGTVQVPGLMEVESYRSVHQLVSTVRGRLRADVSTLDALRALFPAGSMTGAPKRRTMEIIDRVEDSPRGIYAGAFGWIHADGRADLGVVIRSLVATPGPGGDGRGGWHYEWGTGGGVTVDSNLAEEWSETQWKADRIRAALS